MKRTLNNQAKRAGIALALMAAFAVLATGTAQAQSFARADIGVDRLGDLQCTWREAGLGAYAQVTYECGALAVGVVTQCFYKGKPIGGSVPMLSIFKDVTGHESEAFIAKNNGQINGSAATAIPESEGGGHVCTEPAVEAVTAVRWCNASLVDLTNGLEGAAVAELFLQIERLGTGTVPSCTDLLNAP